MLHQYNPKESTQTAQHHLKTAVRWLEEKSSFWEHKPSRWVAASGDVRPDHFQQPRGRYLLCSNSNQELSQRGGKLRRRELLPHITDVSHHSIVRSFQSFRSALWNPSFYSLNNEKVQYLGCKWHLFRIVCGPLLDTSHFQIRQISGSWAPQLFVWLNDWGENESGTFSEPLKATALFKRHNFSS